jgi:hypothetical protein
MTTAMNFGFKKSRDLLWNSVTLSMLDFFVKKLPSLSIFKDMPLGRRNLYY